MEVYFIDVNDTGKNVIHGFGCPLSKSSDREFLGVFNDLHAAVKGALLRFSRIVVCKDCFLEDHESAIPSFSHDHPDNTLFDPFYRKPA